MRRFAIPCVECGILTRNEGARCDKHKTEYENQRELRRRLVKKATGQYSGDYKKRAKLVREYAVTCHICGQGANPIDPWTADHLDPANPDSPLLPAHKSCNEKRGNKPL